MQIRAKQRIKNFIQSEKKNENVQFFFKTQPGNPKLNTLQERVASVAQEIDANSGPGKLRSAQEYGTKENQKSAERRHNNNEVTQ